MSVASRLASIAFAGKSEYLWYWSTLLWAHLYIIIIYSVGTMRCKECFLKHCRDHMSSGNEGCDVCGEKTEILAEGVDLVASKKKKTKQPQSSYSKQMCCVPREDLFVLLILWRSRGSAMWCNNRSQLPSNAYSRASQLQAWPLLKFRDRSCTRTACRVHWAFDYNWYQQ